MCLLSSMTAMISQLPTPRTKTRRPAGDIRFEVSAESWRATEARLLASQVEYAGSTAPVTRSQKCKGPEATRGPCHFCDRGLRREPETTMKCADGSRHPIECNIPSQGSIHRALIHAWNSLSNWSSVIPNVCLNPAEPLPVLATLLK